MGDTFDPKAPPQNPQRPPGQPSPSPPLGPVPTPGGQFPYAPGPMPPYGPGPGDPNYYPPGTEPGGGDVITVPGQMPNVPGFPTSPPPLGPAPQPPWTPSPPGPMTPPLPTGPPPEQPPDKPWWYDLLPGGPGGGGIPTGGGGPAPAPYEFGDPGNLPFVPNFNAPPPGGNYQPTPFTPQYQPWGASDYRGGQTRPGDVVTPEPFSQMGSGPPAVGGGPPGASGGPPPGAPPGGPPPGSFNPNDPYNVYLSSVPVMEREATRQVQNRVAQIAPGNRFSTAATRIAADVGSETALKQNQMFNELMYNHAQQNENRALQATGMGLQTATSDFDRMLRGETVGGQFASQDLDRMLNAAQAGNALGRTQEDISSGRLHDLLGAGQWETDRATKLGLLPYEEFLNSRKGYLPELMQGATSQGAGSNGIPITSQSGGKPGLIDIGMQTAPLWAPWAAGMGPFGVGAK